MKRLMILFAALAAVACAKNNVAEDPAPAAQYLNLTISDFPALESATKSGEVYGKTAWEDGDQLLVVFLKSATEGGSIFDSNAAMTQSFHIATYDNGGWTLDPPIAITESDLSNSVLQIEYQQGMKFEVDADMDVSVRNQNGEEPTDAELIQSEQLFVYNLVRSMDHTITFSKIVDSNGQLVSSILKRTNRVRICYNDSDPNTKLDVVKLKPKYADTWTRPISHSNSSGLASSTYMSGSAVEIPLDENNEAIIYLNWRFHNEKPPVLVVTTTFEQDVALPYGENDQVDAPYPFEESGFANPVVSEDRYEFPYHSNAYAYSVILN